MGISKNTERTDTLLFEELTGENNKTTVAVLFKRTRHTGHKMVLVGRDLSSKLPGRTKMLMNVYDDDQPLSFDDFVRKIAEWVIKREIEKESGLWRKTHEDKVTKYASHSVTLKEAIKLGIASSTNPYTDEAGDVFKDMIITNSCELSKGSQDNPKHRVCQVRHRHWREIRIEANKMIELCNLVEKLERLKRIQQNYKKTYEELSKRIQRGGGKAIELEPEYKDLQKEFNRKANRLNEITKMVNQTLSKIFAIKNTCFQGVDDEHIGLNEILKIQGGGIRKTRRRKRTRRKRTSRRKSRKRSTRRKSRKRSTRRKSRKRSTRRKYRKRRSVRN